MSQENELEFKKKISRKKGVRQSLNNAEGSDKDKDKKDPQLQSKKSKVFKSHKKQSSNSPSMDSSDTNSTKSGPLPNKLQEEVSCIHKEYWRLL